MDEPAVNEGEYQVLDIGHVLAPNHFVPKASDIKASGSSRGSTLVHSLLPHHLGGMHEPSDDTARLLTDAANHFRSHPDRWLQGTFRVTDRRCLMGTVIWLALDRDVDFETALGFVAHLVGDPKVFNDAPGRTVDEVIAVLEDAAEFCRSHK